jgi:hypothetical protein
MMREFVTESILGRIAEAAVPHGPAVADGLAGANGSAAGGPAAAEVAAEASYRAALVASQVLGLALARYVLGLEPLASASQDDLAAAIGPTLERYLTGPVR